MKAHRHLIEAASPHGLNEIGRAEVMRFALPAPRGLRGQAQSHAGDDGVRNRPRHRRRREGAEALRAA
jgi:hypothetical protein